MAALGGARRSLLRSSISPSSLFNVGGGLGSLRPPPPRTSYSTSSSVPSFARVSRRKIPLGISRLPVELGCAQSLMPLHSVTASALLISKLSTKPGNWAWLSEGFATPL